MRPDDLKDDGVFWRTVRGGDVDTCWIRGNTSTYVQWWDHRRCRVTSAHRFAYELMRADIPEGLQIDHLCSNPPCVNPWHLEPVTVRENVRRSFQRGRVPSRRAHIVR